MTCNFCDQPAKYYTFQESSAYCDNPDCEAKALKVESQVLDEHDKARQDLQNTAIRFYESRKAKGLSVEALADRSGLDVQIVMDLEDAVGISDKNLSILAEEVGVSLSYLTNGRL